MNKNNISIILEINQNKNYSIIFNRFIGKIKIHLQFNKNNYYCAASIITAEINKNNNFYNLKNQQLFFIPLCSSLKNLTFLHLILKICNENLPFQSKHTELFDLINKLLINLNSLNSINKKILLLKIYYILDLINENEQELYEIIYKYDLFNFNENIILKTNELKIINENLKALLK